MMMACDSVQVVRSTAHPFPQSDLLRHTTATLAQVQVYFKETAKTQFSPKTSLRIFILADTLFVGHIMLI